MTSRIDAPVGEDHRQAVDADALAARRRHRVLEGPHVVGVEAVRLAVAGLARRELLQEALGLDVRIVQLREGVRDLHAADVELEALGEAGIRAASASTAARSRPGGR